MRLALAIAGKDVKAELRSRTALQSALVFAALVLVVFNFARDPTALSATDLAPSVLWVTFALAAMVALNRAFMVERENAAIDGLLLAPVPREAQAGQLWDRPSRNRTLPPAAPSPIVIPAGASPEALVPP